LWIFEVLTFLLPGLLWFYYDNCNSPLDNYIPTLKSFFFVILSFLIVFLIFAIIQIAVFYICYKISQTMILIYLFIKIIIGFIMIVDVQKGYNDDWSSNTCEDFKSLTRYWLILNYIVMILLTLHLIISFIRTLFSSDKSF